MGRAARAEYEAKYGAQRNYEMLMEIYQGVLEERSQLRGATASRGGHTQGPPGGMSGEDASVPHLDERVVSVPQRPGKPISR